MKNNIKNHNLFEVEKIRNKLATDKNLTDFKDTYKKMAVREKDLNTPKFWDKLNYLGSKLEKSPIYKDKINSVLKLINKNRGNLLDVGFGPAIIEKKLQYLKFKLFGIDISPNSVKMARNSLDGIYKIGNIYKIPFADKSMDMILVLDVLEHLPTNMTFVAYSELNRVLKKGGKIVISIPLNEGLEEMLKNNINPNGHLRDYTPTILEAELKISGFKVLSEQFLYAFQKYYLLKKFFVAIFPLKIKNPNQMIVYAQKQ